MIAETGNVGYIYVPLLNDTVVLERVEAPGTPRPLIVELGRRLPMGVGAGSIALLAAMPPGKARDLVEANAGRYAEFPSLSADAVWRSVEEARAAGYGITREQVARGFIGIALAIRNRNGEPEAAITVVGTLKQMTPAAIERQLAVARRHIAAIEPIDLAGRISR